MVNEESIVWDWVGVMEPFLDEEEAWNGVDI